MFYFCSEGRYEEAPLAYYEKRNKKNSNFARTCHLYQEGDPRVIKWEVSLRQKSQNPFGRRGRRRDKVVGNSSFVSDQGNRRKKGSSLARSNDAGDK